MNCRFRAAKSFWRSWSRLSEVQQREARQSFPIFKANPFDPRLRAHKIHRLSAQYGRTIYAVDIAGDLRATFYTSKAKPSGPSPSARMTFTRGRAGVLCLDLGATYRNAHSENTLGRS